MDGKGKTEVVTTTIPLHFAGSVPGFRLQSTNPGKHMSQVSSGLEAARSHCRQFGASVGSQPGQ